MPSEPQNPAFEQTVRRGFAGQQLMATLGAELTRVVPGEVDVELPMSDRIGQQSGIVHAGAIAAIGDAACGGAALTLMPAGADVVSVEFKLNLLAPASGDRFAARARVLRAGRTLTVCNAEIFAIRAGRETLVANMLGTMMRR